MRPIKNLIFVIVIISSALMPLNIVNAAKQEINSTALLTDANIASYYRFEADGTDTKALINLNLGFAPAFNASVFGNGMDLGSANSTKYASTTSGTALPLTGPQLVASHTTIFWVYLYSLPTTVNGSFYFYEYTPNTDASNIRREYLGFANGSAIDAPCPNVPYNFGLLLQVNPNFYCTGLTLDAGIWYNIASVYDGTNSLIYINGTLRWQKVVSSSTTVFTGSNVPGLTIGAVTGGSVKCSCKFDDVAVFTRALSSKEINTVAVNAAMQIFNGKLTVKNGKLIVNGR